MSKDKSLIKNTLIEEMFLRVAEDEQVNTYVTIAGESKARATAYASKFVYRKFMQLIKWEEVNKDVKHSS